MYFNQEECLYLIQCIRPTVNSNLELSYKEKWTLEEKLANMLNNGLELNDKECTYLNDKLSVIVEPKHNLSIEQKDELHRKWNKMSLIHAKSLPDYNDKCNI